jgi:ribonuclease-3
LGKYIRLGRGEKLTGGHERPSTLADCVEAIFGAVYIDGGYDAGLRVVGRLTDFLVERGDILLAESNPKGRLQELTQQRMQLRPVYEVVDIEGPEHEPQFTVTVSVGDEVQGRAIAGSRRKAEVEAARQALKALQGG